MVFSLYARELTTGEISARFADIYGASVSKDTISRITDRVVEEMTAWHTRPLERVYAAVFIDALHVEIRDGQVGPRPVYAAIGVDLAGHRDVLGMWAGEGDAESAKYWLAVLTELRNRGVADIFFLVCDGLKGLPASVSAVFPDTVVQTCIIHLIRGTFRYAGRQHRDAIARALKPIYTAVNATATAEALDAFDAEWGTGIRRHSVVAQRLERIHPVPGLRHRDKESDLFDQRHHILECPLPPCHPGAWEFFDRASRPEMPILRHPVTGPDRDRPEAMDHALETSTDRLRDHFRRPHAGKRNHLTEVPLTPLI